MRDLAHFKMIGASASFLQAVELIRRFANTTATVLVQGETGTGKELVARAIHYLSARRDMPFVPVNCGALPDTLVESELFGHAQGAFTDARTARPGLVQQTRGGTLFLDEIEAMPARAQVVLLRFLQDKEYRPVGDAVVHNADVRIVGATNADLGALARQGTFRSDLLFRLNALPICLPPLRDRQGDITPLALSFLDRLNRQSGGPALTIAEGSLAILNAYSWPGNVRELENVIQRSFLLATGKTSLEISASELGIRDLARGDGEPAGDLRGYRVAKARAIAQFEKDYIRQLLARSAGNISLASRLSGKDRSDIGKLLRKHAIDRHLFTESS